MSPEGRLPVNSKQFLLHELDSAKGDPHGSLIAMQKALGLDIGLEMGFPPGMVDEQQEEFRAEKLSSSQYEAIKSLEEVTRVFCNFGILEPGQLGMWFDEPNPSLEGRPLRVLFTNLTADGFDPEDVKNVVNEAMSFLRPFEGAREAIQALTAER